MSKYIVFVVLFMVSTSVWFSGCVSENGEVISGDRDEHGCIGSAGYIWCPGKQKCLRIWEEDCTIDKDYCELGGGSWDNCANTCAIDNQGVEGVSCPQVCTALCKCGGIAGLTCPVGYTCLTPEEVADAIGYCVPSKSGGMMLEEALEIARKSECIAEGELTNRSMYNEFTETWWIDLDIEKEGCSPACVISVGTKAAEINWRCTGLLA